MHKVRGGDKNAINNCQNLACRFYYKSFALADPDGSAKHSLKTVALTALEYQSFL
jgi:hypothetical protein